MDLDPDWVGRQIGDGLSFDEVVEKKMYSEDQVIKALQFLAARPPKEEDNARTVFYYLLFCLVGRGVTLVIKESGSWITDPSTRKWGSATKKRKLDKEGWTPRLHNTASFASRTNTLSMTVGANWRDSQEQRVDAVCVAVKAYVKGRFSVVPLKTKFELMARTLNTTKQHPTKNNWEPFLEWYRENLKEYIQ